MMAPNHRGLSLTILLLLYHGVSGSIPEPPPTTPDEIADTSTETTAITTLETTMKTTPIQTTTTVTTTPVTSTATTDEPVTDIPIQPETDCQAFIPKSGKCRFSKAQKVNISASNPCLFKCHYNPAELSPIRFEVHLTYKHPAQNPTFVTVKQRFFISSWTLPILFPDHGENQKFTSIEKMLCPPTNLQNETLEFYLTTESTQNISFILGVSNQSYVLSMGDNVTVKATPVSPWVKLFKWDKEDSILVTADSRDNSDTVCSILALQNAKCPVYADEAEVRAGGTQFQTFTSRAGMVARRENFPDGVHIIVVPLPDDDPCTLAFSERANHTSRQKSVILQVYNHATIASTWYVFLLTAGAMATVISSFTALSIRMIRRNLTSETVAVEDEDERSLLGESGHSGTHGRIRVEEMAGVSVLSGGEVGGTMSEGSRREGVSQERPFVSASLSDGHLSRNVSNEPYGRLQIDNGSRDLQPLPYAVPSTYAPHHAVLNFSASFNPRLVCWWKRLAVYELRTADAQVAEIGFQNNVLIMAVFTALPTTELVRSYLKLLLYHGQEDQCFFNSRCLTAFGTLPDFARVFTNIGYLLCGAAFIIIVKEHKKFTENILRQYGANNSVGVSRHYGLFMSVGYGLFIQGVMSSLYHTCPNSVTIRFDMMFVYVVAVAAVVSMWGFRHGDVTHHVYPTMVMVGMILLMAEAREWVSQAAFWTVLSLCYVFLMVTNTILLTKYGVWSFSPYKMLMVWKGWRPVAEKLRNELWGSATTAKPLQIVRIVIGLVVNSAIILFGCLADPNIYSYILMVCLINMGLYFLNYVIAKICERESVRALPSIALGISLILWILALAAFFFHSTDPEASPSMSRAKNSPCEFFGVFDTHDAWHLMSALALFTFFVGILTLDDDLCHTRSDKIHVF
uniref:SID-1-like protein n=1 Tax=Penaeus vannamei TaxID=6689 RepID=E0A230_PENVA|nr:SID-1-like protein [Penaeus vannamei]